VFTLQSAQLTRVRNYNDRFSFDARLPRDAPSWAYVAQDTPANTDYLPSQTEDEGRDEENGGEGRDGGNGGERGEGGEGGGEGE
jgi:hypothetical protein